jgi:hypothetical protein
LTLPFLLVLLSRFPITAVASMMGRLSGVDIFSNEEINEEDHTKYILLFI